MSQFLTAIGWAGRVFFFSRFLIQWLASERAKKIVVPEVFWWLSVAGALCDVTYALWEGNLVFLTAPAINLFIYLRNLALVKSGKGLGKSVLWPVAVGVFVLAGLAWHWGSELKGDQPWLTLGMTGQVLWTGRFPLQWWLAERRGEATLPPVFFLVSLVGSTCLLTYAISTGNLIYIAGYVLNPFLAGRSLALARGRPRGSRDS